MRSDRILLRALVLLVLGCGASPAFAGGPLLLFDPSTQTPYAYGPSVPVITDLGTLGPVTNAQADVLTANAAAEWSGVATSSFSASVTGDFSSRGLPDITAANATQILNVDNTGDGIFVVYDTDGSIFTNVFGTPPGVLGVASPERAVGSTITESWVFLNGTTIDAGDLPNADSWAGVVTHEMGHSINMAHTQTNGAIIFIGDARGPGGCTAPYPTGGLTLADTETMYPFIDPSPGSTGVQQATIEHLDDTATLSDIYPAAGFPGNFGIIEGVIYDTDGVTPLTGVNVIARNVADPFTDSQSALSGDFTQGATGPDGRYRLTGLTPGADYVVYVDEIEQGGFSTTPVQPLPAPEEFWNASESRFPSSDDPCDVDFLNVAAGQTITADIILNGLDPDPIVNVTPASLAFTLAPGDVGLLGLSIENLATAPAQDLNWTISGVQPPPGTTPIDGVASVEGPAFRRDSGLRATDPVVARQCSDCGAEHDARITPLEMGDLAKRAGTINDGSFELGPFGGAWTETSTNFGTPICDTGTCGSGGGSGPRTGTYWTWFGGFTGGTESGSVSQSVILPDGSDCELQFYLELPVCDTATDFMRVLVDGVEVYRIDGGDALCGTLGYSLQTVDLSSFADGAPHTITFESTTVAAGGGATNFFLDDVALVEQLATCSWLSATPSAGSTPPGGSSAVSVQADATGLAEGTYFCELRIESNDPANPTVVVPVQLDVVAPTVIEASVSTAAPGPVSIPARPDGSGRPLTQALFWDGTVGNPNSTVDATITVQLFDPLGVPIVGFPAENIGVVAQAGGWTECGTLALTADGPTDVNGVTTISGVLSAGGQSAPGELLQVVIDDPNVGTVTYAGGGAGLPIFVNSPDLSGDLLVDLVDVGAFSSIFGGAYDYAADLSWDGQINLADVGEFSQGIGGACPAAVAGGEPADGTKLPETDVIALTFDPEGSKDAIALEPGTPTDAWVVLRGPSAREGIVAWDARVRTSDNVVIHESEPVASTLNVGREGDFVVGFAQARSASEASGLVLLRLRLSVEDDAPAYLWLEPSRRSLHALPTVAVADGMRAARPVSGSPEVAVASLNEVGGDAVAPRRQLALSNTPNPFNPATEIRFSLPQRGRVELRIYDVRGQVVDVLRDEVLAAGDHVVRWNGTDRTGAAVGSGVYYSSLRTDEGTLTRKMLLVK